MIVHKLDRFSRNRYDSAIYKRELQKEQRPGMQRTGEPRRQPGERTAGERHRRGVRILFPEPRKGSDERHARDGIPVQTHRRAAAVRVSR